METYIIPTLLGKVRVTTDGSFVYAMDLCVKGAPSKRLPNIVLQLQQELNEYAQKKRTSFSIPIKLEAKGFYASVYKHMSMIPYGKTLSYKELAEKTSSPRAYRAVGGACNKNPLPILIPCHRVLSSKGLGGFAMGLAVKKQLLKIEEIL